VMVFGTWFKAVFEASYICNCSQGLSSGVVWVSMLIGLCFKTCFSLSLRWSLYGSVISLTVLKLHQDPLTGTLFLAASAFGSLQESRSLCFASVNPHTSDPSTFPAFLHLLSHRLSPISVNQTPRSTLNKLVSLA
jgi:hypothetical protein